MASHHIRLDAQTLSPEFGALVGATHAAYSRHRWFSSHTKYQAEMDAAGRIGQSMRYRFDAMLYHYGLLWLVHDHYLPELEAHCLNRTMPPGFLRVIATQHLYLFDDIVFGAISLLDYFAGLVGLELLGQNSQRLKWNRLVKVGQSITRGKVTPEFSQLEHSGVRELILRENAAWAGELSEYRADIIHHRAEPPDARVHTNLLAQSNASTLVVIAPSRFVQRMALARGAESRNENDPLSIHTAASWLVMKMFDRMASLLLTLRSDVRDLGRPFEKPSLHRFWFPDSWAEFRRASA